MTHRLVTFAVILVALILVHADAFAQRAPACDSTIVVDSRLADSMDVRAQFRDWIPPNAKIELLFDWPRPTNRTTVSRELVRNYPRHLRNRGLGGEVHLALVLDTTGAVSARKLIRSSEYPELDRGAAAVVSALRFDPVRIEPGCAVPVLLRMPIVFRSGK
ncbi:MAG TPA: energy transducer TonB [Longimicrobiales bacterium]